LIDTVLRPLLESNDASMPIEARQGGIGTIVTEDADPRRAVSDFHVCT